MNTSAPAVIVHGLRDIEAALVPRLPLTLLSAPGAANYAGCGWWRALVSRAKALQPELVMGDILDCADAAGRALEALRLGQSWLVLDAACPAFSEVAATAETLGARVLASAPPALDLASPRALHRLTEWLRPA